MLKEKYTGGHAELPPEMPEMTAPEVVQFSSQTAANDGSLRRSRNHARRMRRHGRYARASMRREHGWSVGLW
jgi:hypothetical protein